MSSIRLAASNIGWRKQDDERMYAAMQRLGYSGLEIAPTRIFPQQPYDCLSSVALFAGYLYRRYGLEVASMQSILNGRTENLFDPAGAFALTAYLDEAYRFAAACRCSNLVFGCGANRAMPQGKTLRDADAFFGENGFLAAQKGVTLALEAAPHTLGTGFLERTADVFAYVKRLGAVGLAVNLDIGTMLLNGEHITDIVGDLQYINHIHLSEPGLAPIQPHPIHKELALLLKGLGYQGYVSVEMATTDADTAERALEYAAEVFA